MTRDDRTAQEQLTPEERRTMLRAFADRMLLKVSTMDDPEDMGGVEKAVRVVAVIERIYYRCDRAEKHTPDPRKAEAERAINQSAAIRARVHLASDLEWGEQRQKQLGKWWDAADTTVQAATSSLIPAAEPQPRPQQPADPRPSKTPPLKGNDLRTSVLAILDASFSTYLVAPQQSASTSSDPAILAATDCMVNGQAALEAGDISEAEFDTIEDAVNDWLKSRPPP